MRSGLLVCLTTTLAQAEPIRLEPVGAGRHRVRDRGVATYHVEPDGSIDIEHEPYFDVQLHLPSFEKIKNHVLDRAREWATEWVADPFRDQRHGRMQDLPRHLTATPDACQRYTDKLCETAEILADRRRRGEEDGNGLSPITVRARVFDYLHHKLVGDPLAERKRRVLDHTRDDRIRMGEAYRGSELHRSAELVQRNLEALWRSTTDAASRRAALFALWDECDEGDGALGAAGERARAMVIGWIRARLPVGSRYAYTADEIARLDAQRSSRQSFVPY